MTPLEKIAQRHVEIGHVLGSCSLEADYAPGIIDEQWQQVEFLLNFVEVSKRANQHAREELYGIR
jgi:hypothetical protein